jgi:hypothetical protein
MAMSKPRGDDVNNIFALTGQEEDRDPMYWDDMPEMVQKEKEGAFTIMVRLRNEEDRDRFADLIDQPLLKNKGNTTTKSTWFPKLEKGEGGSDSTIMWVME